MVTKCFQSLAACWLQLSLIGLLSSLTTIPLRAQTVDAVQLPNGTSAPPQELPPPQDVQPPLPAPLPSPAPPAPLPPPEDLLKPPTQAPTSQPLPGNVPETLTIKQFEVVGSTVFNPEELAKLLAPFTQKPITFTQLFEARDAITQLYIDNGYITSGAYIPPQKLQSGVVRIQAIEGRLEDINITGTRRLSPNYVRSRIAANTSQPLNREQLLEALQLLQLNPLIANLSAELSAGSRPGASVLDIQVTEAKSDSIQVVLDNGRSPSVGSFRRRLQANEANFLGLGDSLNLAYSNTDGSNAFDGSYALPLNPRNGTLTLNYGTASSDVIEEPFNFLDIQSAFRYYELTLRQPVVQTPTQEFALGLTASRRESEASFLDIDRVGFPSPGADESGRTRISALRLFQELTQRSNREVIAARSQFNLGIGALNATINQDPEPNSRFFSWQGQAQWARLLASDTLLLLRADVQLSSTALVPIEQFGLGGLASVRGYRQDLLLTDNGAFASAEVQLPILRVPQLDGILQLTPFVDFGTTWNNNSDRFDPDISNTLASIGLGLRWSQGDRFTARIDWGIPLISVDSTERTWQENGVYFSIQHNLF